MSHSTRHTNRHRTATFSSPEALETRIAPAALLATPEISGNGKSATWTDVDGDTITLTISKGTLDAAENFDLEAGTDGGAILQKLNLTAAEFKGTNVTIKAVRSVDHGGDNSVNIGFIDATNNTLGAVKISGDLAQISAGMTELTTKTATAIKSLNVKSMGLLGDSVLDQPGDLTSSVSGKIGSLTVAGSVQGVSLSVTGGSVPSLGSIGSIKIGGSLIGGDSANSGQIATSGNIGAIVIGGSVEGGRGQSSGVIDAGGNIASVSITGSIFGGNSNVIGTENTGVVRADGKIGSVKINGNIEGGTQQRSGVLESGSDIGSVTINGSIFGGKSGAVSGAVKIGGNVKTFTVGGSITGDEAVQSGYVNIAGSVGNVTVKGSVQGGSALETGFIQLGTDITDTVGKLSILGSIRGGSGESSGAIQSAAKFNDLSVGGNLIGGDLELAATKSLNQSGYIEAGLVSKLKISGSIQTGTNYSANPELELLNNASIRIANSVGSFTVGGDITGSADTNVIITARGSVPPVPVNALKDVAFGSISVGGSVRHTEILAGYDESPDQVEDAADNPNAQIGSVTIKKDWIASSLVAGAAYNENFGDGNDVKIGTVDTPSIVASIARIVIGGQVIGTGDTATDHFGFVAEEIMKFQLGTSNSGSFALSKGWSDDNNPTEPRYNVGTTGDTRIFEFARFEAPQG